MTFPRLANPPVLEVVLDFGVDYPGVADPERMRAFVASLGSEFPDPEPVYRPSGDGGDEVRGYIAYAPESSRAVQVADHGLTINDLVPYTTWEAVEAGAQPVWTRFCEAFAIERVRRLGLRYINRLALPPDETGTRELLRSWPAFCGDLIERRPEGFLLRMDVPLAEPGVEATISHVLSHPDEETVEVVVDNHVYIPAYDGAPDDVWTTFHRLREIKNRLFFGALTDDALAPYR